MSRKISKHFNSRIIEDFLEGYNFAENTKSLYRSNLKKYFEFLNVDPDTYFEKDRNYKEDVLILASSHILPFFLIRAGILGFLTL